MRKSGEKSFPTSKPTGDSEGDETMGTPARMMEATRISLGTSYARERAVEVFNTTRRRRRVRATYDTIADAALATGGLVLANATMGFGMGLPEGRNGIALGGSLVAAGLMWLTRLVRSGGSRKDPAMGAEIPMLIITEPEQLRRAA